MREQLTPCAVHNLRLHLQEAWSLPFQRWLLADPRCRLCHTHALVVVILGARSKLDADVRGVLADVMLRSAGDVVPGVH